MMQIIVAVLVAFVVKSELTEAASEMGWTTSDHAHTHWGSSLVFVDKRLAFPFNGAVTGWKLYSRVQGTVLLQVWRPNGDDICTDMQLVGQTEVVVDDSNLGLLSIDLDPDNHIDVQYGDMIGWNSKNVKVANSSSSSHTEGQSYDLDTKYSLNVVYEEDDVQLGWDTVYREFVDSGSSQVFVDKRFTFPLRGEIIGWKLFTRGQGMVNLQAWRPASEGSCSVTLLGETEVVVSENNAGLMSVELDIEERIAVEQGDMFGWSDQGKGVITADMKSGTQYHCNKYQSSATVGQMYDLDGEIGWGPERKYSVQAVYQGLLGWDEVNRAYTDSGSGQVFIDKRLVFPDDGIVTGWQLYTRGKGTVFLQIWRPASQESCDVQLVGQTKVTVKSSNNGFMSFDLSEDDRIHVKAGDLIGWNNPGKGVITADMNSGEQHHCSTYRGTVTVGESDDLSDVIGWGPNRKYSLSAKFKSYTKADVTNEDGTGP